MLEGRKLDFRYTKNRPFVLNNASVTINPGEIVGLSGYSGQGKTTLAKILSGYAYPVSGVVQLDDQPLPVKGFCPVQMIFQHPERAFNPHLTLGDSINEAGPVPTDVLEKFHVEKEWLKRRPHELSGGELQRMAITRVLKAETRYLIADEITTMLDVLSQATIWDVICRFARQHNLGVLMISHSFPLMEKLCDRILDISAIQSG